VPPRRLAQPFEHAAIIAVLALRRFDRDDHRRNNRHARQHVGLQLGLDVGHLALAPRLELGAPSAECVGAQKERGSHFLEALDAERWKRAAEHRNRRRLHDFHQEIQIGGCRLVQDISRMRLSGPILQPRVRAKLVLRPHRVVERERDAGLTTDAVERPHCSHLAGRGLVRLGVGIEVVEDVEQGQPVLVLREVEQTAVRAFDALDPVVVTGLLRACLLAAGDRHGGGGTENPAQETATMRFGCQTHVKLLHARKR
jgi:hypothetical protein